MKEELDQALVRDFPLLYRDRYGSMQGTCMCWGFPGDGWEPLIRELSSKLEPIIQKFVDENESLDCAQCGCKEVMHEWLGATSGRCYTIHQLPYCFRWKWKSISWPSKANNWNDRWKIFKVKYLRYGLLEKVKRWIARGINFVLVDVLHEQFGLTKRLPCYCKKYLMNHPCASQVKEKYGTLCFYMTSASDEMYKLIGEAEKKSEVTCEVCGNKGEGRNDYGWYSTLCETHAINHEGKRIPTHKEVDEELEKEEKSL